MKETMREEPAKKRCFHQITLKGSALLDLIDAGVIQPDENGNVDTDGFERFWIEFEKKMEADMAERMSDRDHESFEEKYPNFPLYLSLIALIASIIVPILRRFLEGMI